MNGIALDPIGYCNALRAAGMPEAQAEVIAKTQQAQIEKTVEKRLAEKLDEKELADKADIRMLQGAVLESEMRQRTEMREMELRLIKWIVGTIFVSASLIVAVLKLLS